MGWILWFMVLVEARVNLRLVERMKNKGCGFESFALQWPSKSSVIWGADSSNSGHKHLDFKVSQDANKIDCTVEDGPWSLNIIK
jgi:hypothetical protein